MKRQQILQKIVYEKFYVYEKILLTRNCRRNFIKNLLPEKREETMQTKPADLVTFTEEILNGKLHFL